MPTKMFPLFYELKGEKKDELDVVLVIIELTI
jgi:hypothetical protein